MSKNIILTKIKKYKIHLVFSIVLTIFLSLLVSLFIRNFSKILFSINEDTLGTIFSQLNDADIRTPFIIEFIFLFFAVFVVLKFNYNKNKCLKIIISIIISIISFIILLVLSILLSKVNGVLFIDVLVSLLENMEGLGL